MTLDTHVHLIDPRRVHYPWLADPALARINRPFLPQDLLGELRQNQVDGVILVQTRSSLEESAEFLALAARHPFIRGVVAWADLTSPGLEAQLERLQTGPGGRTLVGIRHQVHDEPDPNWLLRQDVQRGLAVLAEHRLTYDLLLRPREMPAALEVVRAHPNLTFVLDHCGKPPIASGQLEPWGAWLDGLAGQPNLLCKVSGLVTEADWNRWTLGNLRPYVERVVRAFGRERLLFGSDWPVCLLASSYAQVKAAFAELVGFDPGTAHHNARRAYPLLEVEDA